MELAIIEKNFRPDYFNKQIKLQKSIVGLSPQVYFSLTRYLDVYIYNIG
jgi:hypothetical protein